MDYSINVPEGTGRLEILLEVSAGEAEIATNYGEVLTRDAWFNDQEECWDWAYPGVTSDSCSMDYPTPGTWYITVKGADEEYIGSGDYTLTATLLADPLFMKPGTSSEELEQAMRRIASRYLKHALKGAGTAHTDATYPETGTLIVEKGENSYRFYFGSEAVAPAVLSIDHNGQWVNYYSWDDFEADMAM